MSYHPETKQAKYFLIQYNSLVWSVVKLLTDHIVTREPITEWPHLENKYLRQIESETFGRIPDFQSLKPLRSYINQVVIKDVPEIIFCNDSDV